MVIILLLLYVLPIYLVFFRYKLISLTIYWKVGIVVPPIVTLFFLWFALGRYTPLAQAAYVQAPVIQIIPQVGGFVTDLAIEDNEEVEHDELMFQIDQRPYQYGVDKAQAKLIETQETTLGLLADLYVTKEVVKVAEANLLVAKQNLSASFRDLETASQSANDAAKQLELAENTSSRQASLLPSGAISREEYDISLRDVTSQRSRLNEAQNRVSQAETATEVSTLLVNAAEAAVHEARAKLGKAEVMVDPVTTLRRVLENRQKELTELEREVQSSEVQREETAAKIQKIEPELVRLRDYLEKATTIDPIRADSHPAVRQAIEDFNDAKFDLEQTSVKAPTKGVVTNLQLTAGTYVQPGVPIASVIDTQHWRIVATVPENWLEKIRAGDLVYFSLRNYPGRIRTAKVEYVGRGVLQGQGIPSGNLPDTTPRQTRQTDTPQFGQEFQVICVIQDDQADEPLRVGMTGRVTVFASGGLPGVNQLSTILHALFSWLDYLHPQPSPALVLLLIALVAATTIGLRYVWR